MVIHAECEAQGCVYSMNPYLNCMNRLYHNFKQRDSFIKWQLYEN